MHLRDEPRIFMYFNPCFLWSNCAYIGKLIATRKNSTFRIFSQLTTPGE